MVKDKKLQFLDGPGGTSVEVALCCGSLSASFIALTFVVSVSNCVLNIALYLVASFGASHVASQVWSDWTKVHLHIDPDFLSKGLGHEAGFLIKKLASEACPYDSLCIRHVMAKLMCYVG